MISPLTCFQYGGYPRGSLPASVKWRNTVSMDYPRWISNKLGLLSDEETSFLKESILKLPLPQLGELNYKSILGFIKSDKKYQSGVLHFVVLNGLGNAIISNKITEELIVNSLKEIQ